MGKTRCVNRVERALDHPAGQRNYEVSKVGKEGVGDICSLRRRRAEGGLQGGSNVGARGGI